MRRLCWISVLIFGLVLSWTFALAGDFYVIPTQKKNFAPVQKTGQTTSYATGDDGDLQKGVAWPDPRFTDNGNGTVTDNLTGLIWLKDADPYGRITWAEALTECSELADGSYGLTDGSDPGDWRLPSRFELESLFDLSKKEPCLPAGYPFTNVRSTSYWSSTTSVSSTEYACLVGFQDGGVAITAKTGTFYVWCVRGGR